jgi:predicted nucleotidyltransferase component of viral defense system
MIPLTEIRDNYPLHLHSKSEFLLREYLQYKILELIFESTYAEKFAFLGGTCLRIVYDNQRFSEDLDFDNFDLSETDFEQVSKIVADGLQAEGYKVEIRNVVRGAFHCYIRFPGILFETGLSGHKEARILINLDTEPQHFDFVPDLHYLNRFDVFAGIKTTPLDLLLSQKITAITQRRQPKGRDFFDTVFLLSRTKPNYGFLTARLGIDTPEALRKHLLAVCSNLNFQALAADVQPFLFNPSDIRRVLSFADYIVQANF